MQALNQYMTYEGLLLGYPTLEMNRGTMERLVATHTRPGEYGTPLLLEPEQRPFDIPDNVPRHGTPASLPSITCIARFISDRLKGADDIWSVLRVIWFQSDFAFPIEDRVLRQITEIDWEAHATGWEP